MNNECEQYKGKAKENIQSNTNYRPNTLPTGIGDYL